MQKFINLLLRFSQVLGSICIVGISVVVFVGVLARYVFLYSMSLGGRIEQVLAYVGSLLGGIGCFFEGRAPSS